MNLVTILLVILIVFLLIGAVPLHGIAPHYGYGSGGLGLILVIVLLILLFGR